MSYHYITEILLNMALNHKRLPQPPDSEFDDLLIIRSSGSVVAKLLACGARGSGFESRFCRYGFRD